MSKEFPPPYSPDNPQQWAEDLNDYLTRNLSLTPQKVSTDKANENGIVLFDASVLALVVSRSNEFVQVLANKGNANLPTSDPAVAGALWNDSGTVKVSSG
ncbi:MAG: hypothetical protein VXX72_05325 [Pseudomonadota bacterium]|nr:hypothetical protein [Pseudomonadota bacterium]